MKILIIGGDGQLGNDCQKILAAQHTLLVPREDELDITRKSAVDSMVEKSLPEIIINCAAYTAVDKCETHRDLAWKVNAEGAGYLAQAAEKAGARFIHISTDYVFDGLRSIPQAYIETDKVNPLSEYGKSKLAGEQAIIAACSNHLILRTAWLYSAHGPNFLKTMLRLTSADPKRQLRVVNDQYGSLTWSYTLAEQIQLLLEKPLTGIFHTTSEGYSTWYEAACYFLEKMNQPHCLAPCTTEEYPTPAIRPKNSILENKGLKELDLSCFGHWQKELDRYVEEHQHTLQEEICKEIG